MNENELHYRCNHCGGIGPVKEWNGACICAYCHTIRNGTLVNLPLERPVAWSDEPVAEHPKVGWKWALRRMRWGR